MNILYLTVRFFQSQQPLRMSHEDSIASIFTSFSIIHLTFVDLFYSSENLSVVVVLSFAAIVLGNISLISSINTAGFAIDGL